MNTHPGLFDLDRPRQVEVAGPELAGVLADLKRRGAHVSGMLSVNNSGWRLTIEWPDPPKISFKT